MSALDGGEWSSSCSGRFTPEKEPRYALKRRLCRPQKRYGHFGRGGNSVFPLSGFNAGIVQPVTQSLYRPYVTDVLSSDYCILENADVTWLVSWTSQVHTHFNGSRGQLKCDGTRAETRFRLSAKRTRAFKSAGASVQSTTGSRGVRISGSNADTPCSEQVWRVLATHSIRQFPLHFPSRASPCAFTFQLESNMFLCKGVMLCCYKQVSDHRGLITSKKWNLWYWSLHLAVSSTAVLFMQIH